MSHPLLDSLKEMNANSHRLAHELADREWADMRASIEALGVRLDTKQSVELRQSFVTGVVIGYMEGIAAVLTATEKTARAAR